MITLQNKIAIVTGANSGIGKGIAQKFVQLGARVVLFGRNAETLERTQQEIGAENTLIVQGDVTSTEDLQGLFKTTVSRFGKIDILVANAGVAEQIGIEEVTEEKFDYLVDINYRGLFFTLKYAIDYLNQNASVILISSCAAQMTFINHSVYSSTKAAVLKLAQNASYDLAKKLIRVNSISPGYIETPIFSTALSNNPEYLKEQSAYIPLKRIGTPEDIANTAAFLASEEASYITGADIKVDGGITASFPII
ncbi:acetyoacetyl CoA reductase (plasmid) [Legionella adelaidensis]|uniref:Acetyoacetyl CoA reductase n=1 Tax=Legionella adelaidensis TaxID=45056 RepID=A0A0W0R5D6_9GAMM|nr:SDR family oxidoreductase [Legionella adelaidensis]KTC66291.1 acetyoacetyl CoA reductase [Legionella adelaidensis]VEH84887.1 acetyoacetyl CoA reductase [Legionella adelaidensis]